MNFFETLVETLKTDKRFVSQDGDLLKPAIIDAAASLDAELLHLLLSEEILRKHFFTRVDDILVFDKEKFQWVINSKEFLPDSFTSYRNKIGLSANDHDLLTSSNEVSLVWPYKDCILEGGQDKDDEKREEIFYNETLAPDEVSRLLAPKAFKNAVRYSAKGVEAVTKFNDTDNFIIKGNNLLALSSLLERFEGQVKCIYIDPPYYFEQNKSEDTFSYNSNFKKSTWLTFMRNRLELAKELLSPDGAIFVQISDDGVAELHILLKEVFGGSADHFINKITVKTKSPSGFASVNAGVFETAEYILAFAKSKQKWKYNTQYIESGYDPNYKFVVVNKQEPCEKWIIRSIVDVIAEDRGYSSAKTMRAELGKKIVDEMIAEYASDHADAVFRFVAIGNNAGRSVVETRNQSKGQPDYIFAVERPGQYTVYIHKGQEIAFYSKKLHEVDGKLVPSIQVSNIWTDTPYEGIAKEGSVTLKGGKKPEKLVRRIFELSSEPGDLVMDFFLGSGTSAAVAHKIGRRYIGVEQLDYGTNGTINRLRNVINGDKSGISKIVNWEGGGSFVYAELAEQSEKLMKELETTKDTKTVQTIFNEATNSGLLRPSVIPDDVRDSYKDFETLSLDDQKRIVAELIDKNRLYINYSDMEDSRFDFAESDKAFTRSFYSEERAK